MPIFDPALASSQQERYYRQIRLTATGLLLVCGGLLFGTIFWLAALGVVLGQVFDYQALSFEVAVIFGFLMLVAFALVFMGRVFCLACPPQAGRWRVSMSIILTLMAIAFTVACFVVLEDSVSFESAIYLGVAALLCLFLAEWAFALFLSRFSSELAQNELARLVKWPLIYGSIVAVVFPIAGGYLFTLVSPDTHPVNFLDLYFCLVLPPGFVALTSWYASIVYRVRLTTATVVPPRSQSAL